MLHKDLDVKEFTVKETAGFRMRVRSWEVVNPKGLHNVDFIQESFDVDGNVDLTSTYNFHLTKEEIGELCKGLMAV